MSCAILQRHFQQPVEILRSHLQSLMTGLGFGNQTIGLHALDFFQKGKDFVTLGGIAVSPVEHPIIAILGQGKNHAKWSPGLAYYKKVPLINLDGKKLSDEDKKKLNRLSKDVFELSNNKLKLNQDKLTEILRMRRYNDMREEQMILREVLEE